MIVERTPKNILGMTLDSFPQLEFLARCHMPPIADTRLLAGHRNLAFQSLRLGLAV